MGKEQGIPLIDRRGGAKQTLTKRGRANASASYNKVGTEVKVIWSEEQRVQHDKALDLDSLRFL